MRVRFQLEVGVAIALLTRLRRCVREKGEHGAVCGRRRVRRKMECSEENDFGLFKWIGRETEARGSGEGVVNSISEKRSSKLERRKINM
jgi:hypothetical protein